ncbi:MAG: ABC transporter permease subunit [Actinomycetales bacterium]|nr:ABC transporter permease subunit [Actinomycetales bacterium]
MSAAQRTVAQAGWEARLLMRNGEQLLLTVVIPVGILLALTLTDLVATATGPDRLPTALATVLSVSILSGCFTSLAIATAFERRSGALRFLGTTPLTRTELLVGKLLATAAVTAISVIVVTVLAVVLGWRPTAGSAWAVPELVLGAAAFAAWGFALAGLLRAEAVLAVANGIFLLLLMFGGIVVPASSLPGALGTVVAWLPSGALASSLADTLVSGAAPGLQAVVVLLAWFAAGTVIARRTFRWS